MHRSQRLHVLLLLALIIPLTGTTFLTGSPTAAQQSSGLNEAPVLTDDSVLSQEPDDFRSAAAPLTVDTSNREAVRSFFNQYYVDVPASDNRWNGDLDTCDAGTTSQAYKDAVSLRINFFRAMAGVPAGTGISNVTSAKAQQAALMMNANHALDHNPPSSWTCYTAEGAEAAGSSNLAYGYGPYGWYVIDMYIEDPGANNAQVGHRAYLLHPQTQLFGLGDTRSYNALWVFDEHYWDPRPATREPFVAWPPKGFVPYQIVYPRWSFQYPDADFANATVTMMSNGASIPVSIESRQHALGNGIVWNPVGVNFPDPNNPFSEPFGGEQTFTVSISNVSLNGQSRSFTYDVTVIDPAVAGSNATASLSTTRGIPRSHVTASVSGFGNNTSVPVKWGNTLLTTITTNSSGSGSGAFRVPYAPMGVYPITFGAGGGPLTKSFEVVPRIKLIPESGSPGDTVEVSLRGFKARETVRIRWEQGSSWVEIARVTTSHTGSANLDIEVPSWAPSGANSVRGDSTESGGGRAQTNAFTVDAFQAGTMTLSANRGTVNTRLTATLSDFPANIPVTLTFPGFYEATATGTTDGAGTAVLELRIPATPLGAYTVRATGGETRATGSYEVVPRIKLVPGTAAPGETVNVSLRGYGAKETVRIRWQQGASWTELSRVTTSSSGSANIDIQVPSWAPAGDASVRGDATVSDGGRAQTNAFTVVVPQAGTMALSANRGTVNTRLTATLSNFPPNTAVTLTFPGFYEETVTGTTDGAGVATLQLRIPATPLGEYTVTAEGGGTQATGSYEVVPRIKLIPGTEARGETINVSLRGYGAHHVVRIRWQQEASWIELTRVTTSSSGSANIDIAVPSWAPDGATSVRGDAVLANGGRAQTNAFTVDGGQFASADATTATPIPTPTPTTEAKPVINTVWTPFADNFENGTLDQWTEVDGISVQAGDARDGAMAAVATSAGAPAFARANLNVPQPGLYVRASFKPVAQGDNPVRLLQLRGTTDTPVVEVSLDAASHLVITNTLTGRQATGPVVDPGEWHDLQLHVRTGGNGMIEVWLDGDRIADLSGSDTLGTDPLAFLLIGDDTGGRGFTMLFDSIGVDLQCLGSCPATVEPTPEVTPEPTATAEPTIAPTEEIATPTPEPTNTPDIEPTAEPTASLDAEPTGEPTAPPEVEPIDSSDESSVDAAPTSDEEMNQD